MCFFVFFMYCNVGTLYPIRLFLLPFLVCFFAASAVARLMMIWSRGVGGGVIAIGPFVILLCKLTVNLYIKQ